HRTPCVGGFLLSGRYPACHLSNSKACNATLSGSQTPMASRMNDSSARFSRIRKIAVFDVRPFTYEGLALPICSQSFGLAPSSAPNSTYKAFFDVPANAARLARLNTSPGSSGFGGVPIFKTKAFSTLLVDG